MSTQRIEPWGCLTYNANVDEFEASVRTTGQGIRIDRPISAGCLVTGRCNLKCQYCYGNDESLPNKELSTSEWDSIFGRLKSWGLMRVDLSGGEPTIRNDITDIARSAFGSGLNVVVSTNGLPLIKRGLSILPSAVRLHISIDSGFADIHEASRVRRNLLPSTGSLAKVMDLAKAAVDAGYRVRILTCIGSHNSNQLIELGERLAVAGIDEWNISRLHLAGGVRWSREIQFIGLYFSGECGISRGCHGNAPGPGRIRAILALRNKSERSHDCARS